MGPYDVLTLIYNISEITKSAEKLDASNNHSFSFSHHNQIYMPITLFAFVT
jgi:hypothetical protein